MNNKGLAVLFLMMVTIAIIVLGLALAGPVKTFVDDVRAQNSSLGGQGLDCAEVNTTLSDFDRGACVVTDLYTPAFLGVLIGIAVLLIGAKVVLTK